MELKSLLIYSILLSSIKYLLFHTVITFIPNTRIILKLVDLTFSTLVLIVNFHFVSSIPFVDVLFMKRISISDTLQCHIPADLEITKALTVFVLSDFLNRIFQLTNSFELVKSLLFAYFIVEGFYINQVGIVLLLGIIQNLLSMLNYFFCQFSRSQIKILIRINLIFLISFWLYSFLLVIPYHFYQILRLQCDKVADYRLKTFSFVFFCYYIVEMYLNPVTKYRRFLEREFFIISKILKLDFSFSRKEVAKLEESKTEAKTCLMKSPKNTKNQVMMMQMIRCVISLKKKAKRIKEKNKSEDKENESNSTTEMLH